MPDDNNELDAMEPFQQTEAAAPKASCRGRGLPPRPLPPLLPFRSVLLAALALETPGLEPKGSR